MTTSLLGILFLLKRSIFDYKVDVEKPADLTGSNFTLW